MGFWGVRAGKLGEQEAFALDKNCVVVGWNSVEDLSGFSSRGELRQALEQTYPGLSDVRMGILSGQLWSFVHNIEPGDLVALPRKGTGLVAFGEVQGPYRYVKDAPTGAKHQRPVRWLDVSFARTRLDEDIINSLGSLLTVFRVKAEGAESRIRDAISGRAARADAARASSQEAKIDVEASDVVDLERTARDRIIDFIRRRFVRHRLEELVAAVLQAQGFLTDRTPQGPDGGVDILASRGPLGLDGPRLAVQVKSSDSPSDVAQVRALKGVMKDFGADIGLFVSWSGFRGIATRELRRDFFQMRLWNAETLLDEILAHYDELSRDIQAELPLKRYWALVAEADEIV